MKKFILFVLVLLSSPAFAVEVVTPPKEDSGENAVPDAVINQISVMISSQIRPCWKIPDTKNSTPLEAIIHIDQMGNLKFVEFTGEVTDDQKILAKSVQDAVNDPNCNPIQKLPPTDLYYIWENLPLLFAPKN